jgi:hypothetical protein
MDFCKSLDGGNLQPVHDVAGLYPTDSINGRVEATRHTFAKNLQEFDKERKEGDK